MAAALVRVSAVFGDGLKLFLRAGVFLVALSLLLVVSVPRDSAEFVVSVLSLLIGLVLVILSLLWGRR